ncbi:MAG: KH domain-containing protein [Candidatus Bipolaricaulia bacterium]
MLRQLLEFLIRPLVEDMANVRIECTETPTMTLFCLWARKGDLGRILGKKGQTIEDIRRVMETVAARDDREVIIDVLEQPKETSPSTEAPSS